MTHATDGLVNWAVLSLHFLGPGVVRRHNARVGVGGWKHSEAQKWR